MADCCSRVGERFVSNAADGNGEVVGDDGDRTEFVVNASQFVARLEEASFDELGEPFLPPQVPATVSWSRRCWSRPTSVRAAPRAASSSPRARPSPPVAPSKRTDAPLSVVVVMARVLPHQVPISLTQHLMGDGLCHGCGPQNQGFVF